MYHTHVNMYTQYFLMTCYYGWIVEIFTQIFDIFLFKIADTSDIYR